MLQVSWTTLHIHNNHLNISFDFHDEILLCLLQSLRLRRILRDNFWCILTARYEHCLYRIDLAYLDKHAPDPSNDVDVAIPVPTKVILSGRVLEIQFTQWCTKIHLHRVRSTTDRPYQLCQLDVVYVFLLMYSSYSCARMFYRSTCRSVYITIMPLLSLPRWVVVTRVSLY